jgi:hypothetical protein
VSYEWYMSADLGAYENMLSKKLKRREDLSRDDNAHLSGHLHSLVSFSDKFSFFLRLCLCCKNLAPVIINFYKIALCQRQQLLLESFNMHTERLLFCRQVCLLRCYITAQFSYLLAEAIQLGVD